MANWLEKSVHMGLGLFMYSREKIEDFVEDLVSRGEVAQKDARQFAGDLVKRGEEQKEALKKMIDENIDSTLNHMNIAKKEDLITKEEIQAIVKEQVKEALREQGATDNSCK
ncbi:MAG: hypothetical protein PHT34_06575 [Oscillospiraceae bacterium]|nr:hypothetical protein [Oscillospiraceae bacterium]